MIDNIDGKLQSAPLPPSPSAGAAMEHTGIRTCRLCSGALNERFRGTLLNKYDVQYYECQSCKSLQTEPPFWLAEAYGHNLSSLDTGAGQRNLTNLAACYVAGKLFGFRNIVDVGGGDGLLCRLLRDYGFNCFVQDKYARPTYAQGFTEPDFQTPDLVVAFEVVEHFADPRSDLDALFGLNSGAVLISTALYTGEEESWWYLSPESGQHVFFYTDTALKLIADRYDYRLIISGGFILFVKPALLTSVRSLLVRYAMTRKLRRLAGALLAISDAPGVWKDHARIQSASSTSNDPKR